MPRKYGVLGAAAMLTVTLAACAPDSGDDSGGGDAVNLKVWGWRQEDVAAYNKIFQIYEGANPGVTVEYVPTRTPSTTQSSRQGSPTPTAPTWHSSVPTACFSRWSPPAVWCPSMIRSRSWKASRSRSSTVPGAKATERSTECRSHSRPCT